MRAVASPGAQDGVHTGIAPGFLEVAGAVLVGAGEVAEPWVGVEHVGCRVGIEVPSPQQVEAALQPVGGHGTAGGDDRDPGAGPQPGRTGEGLQGHFLSSSRGTSERSMPNACA